MEVGKRSRIRITSTLEMIPADTAETEIKIKLENCSICFFFSSHFWKMEKQHAKKKNNIDWLLIVISICSFDHKLRISSSIRSMCMYPSLYDEREKKDRNNNIWYANFFMLSLCLSFVALFRCRRKNGFYLDKHLSNQFSGDLFSLFVIIILECIEATSMVL